MKGISSTIVTALIGGVIALTGLMTITSMVDAMAEGQSVATGSSQADELARTINNTCKQAGVDQKTVSLNLKNDRSIDIEGYEVKLNGGEYTSTEISACKNENIDITDRTLQHSGMYYIEIDDGKVEIKQ